MSSLPIFPTLIGEAWPVTKRPIFSTTVQEAQSGAEVRIGNFSFPFMEWEIPFNWLSQEDAYQDFQALFGLFLQNFGQFGVFLYKDPSDFQTLNYAPDPLTGIIKSSPGPIQIGVGDGLTKEFQLGNIIGGGFEAVGDPIEIISISPGGYTIAPNGILVYPTPVTDGMPIMANFSFYFRVRFKDDDLDFDNFVKNWWEQKKITLRQVRS